MSLPLLFPSETLPTFDSQFLSGVLPPGLTYTNGSTTRTYFGADGLLKTAAANAPIFEYNPVTLALLGMRWEMEQRTNLLLQSVFPGGGLAPTGWSGGGGGISGPASSIYGNTDGSQAWTQTATANRPFISQASSTLSANTTYTLSMLIESVSGTVLADNVLGAVGIPAGASTSYPVCSANPSGGSSNITSGTLEVIVAIGATAGAVTVRAGLGISYNTTSTIKFSRPMLEVGTSRSSFIPTTTAAVTRQPDVLTASSISWYRQDEGTVLFEGIASTPATTQRGMYLFSDGTDNERISAYRASSLNGGVLVVDGGVTQADVSTLSSMAQSAVSRHALAYKVNDFAGSVNGGTPVADAAGTLPTITGLKLGQGNTAGTQAFMGYARRFQYFNTRLPNAQIQGMSRV